MTERLESWPSQVRLTGGNGCLLKLSPDPSFIDTFKPFPPFSSRKGNLVKGKFPRWRLLASVQDLTKLPSTVIMICPCHLLSWQASPPLNGALKPGTKPFPVYFWGKELEKLKCWFSVGLTGNLNIALDRFAALFWKNSNIVDLCF